MIMVLILILMITNYSLYSFGMEKDYVKKVTAGTLKSREDEQDLLCEDLKNSGFGLISPREVDNTNEIDEKKSNKRVCFKLSELDYCDESHHHDSLKNNQDEQRENLRSILVKKNRQPYESLSHEEDTPCCMACFTAVGCSVLSCCCCLMARLGLFS